MVASVLDPNWVVALVASGGAFVGAWRVLAHFYASRRERQDGYEQLYCDVEGWPAETDKYGNVTSPARPGLKARVARLEAGKGAGHG